MAVRHRAGTNRLHGVGAVGKDLGVHVLVGIVHIEPVVAHNPHMVPQLAQMLLMVAFRGEEGEHGIDHGVGTFGASVAVFYGKTVVYHVLYIAPVFG